MDFGRNHRFWSVASRIYLELKNSRKIKIMLGNRNKTVSGDVIIAPEMMPLKRCPINCPRNDSPESGPLNPAGYKRDSADVLTGRGGSLLAHEETE